MSWQKQLVEELHKPLKKDFTRRHVILHHIDEIWSADLVDLQQFSKGYKYLLMVIDVFSIYGWIKPLKDK